jgi:hypothetical protein
MQEKMNKQTITILVSTLIVFCLLASANAYPVNKEKKVVKSHYKSWGYNPDYSLRCNRIAYGLIGGKTPSTMPMSVKTHKMMSIGCFKPTL